MVRILYHGSENRIEKPQFGYGKTYNDYGLGFYCTENENLAKEWAVDYERGGYVNSYTFDDANLSILRLNEPPCYALHWLSVLLENRTFEMHGALSIEGRRFLMEHFLPKYITADVIIGYRADDSYFSYAQDFLNGTISLEMLAKAMRLGELGEQVVIKSKRAFEKLVFSEALPVDASIWYPQKINRDQTARKQYRDFSKSTFKRDEVYLLQLLREEVDLNDSRLRI